jgi:deoxyribodipyrimidine photo-lyase
MIEEQRLAVLNSAPEARGAYVLYWMQQSQRAVHNPALETGIAAANRLKLPLLVAFALDDTVHGANARHYTFMLEGLAETAGRLHQRGIGFVIRRGKVDEVIPRLADRAALVVCDRGYLRRQTSSTARVASAANCRVVRIEGDVVVPTELASDRAELGARTLRPRLARYRSRFLVAHRSERVHVRAYNLPVASDVDLQDVPGVVRSLKIDQSVQAVNAFRGGYSQAHARLRRFLMHELRGYEDSRSKLAAPQVSRLSPYLHFGQISPVEIALATSRALAPTADQCSFLDELIVRRELAANFVLTSKNYARFECVPGWAQESLKAHARDRRPHVYKYSDLAAAGTHDAYWNAAMTEMLVTGYMHNHLRMYWGKKILEWSASPEEAYQTLLQLNNTYFLDGRDPCSFANVAWVFGLHDRPWPEREIFGKVRYMNAAGLRRKTDIEAYTRQIGIGATQGVLL